MLEIFFGLLIIGAALYFGLRELAQSISSDTNSYNVAKDALGRVKKAQVIRREDEIEKAIKEITE